MKKTEIMKYIEKTLFDKLSIEIDSTNPNAFIRELGIDSISLMALTVYLENQYDIVADAIFENYDNEIKLIDIVNFVFKQIND